MKRSAICLGSVVFACAILLFAASCSSTDEVFNPPPNANAGAAPACSDMTGNRFVDCGNGTVTDTMTGKIWLKNANCFGAQTWAMANTQAGQLADGQCGLTDGSSAGDWHLPSLGCGGATCVIWNVATNMAVPTGEFGDIFVNPALCNPNIFLPNTQGGGCYVSGDPFDNVQQAEYWSGSMGIAAGERWRVNFAAAVSSKPEAEMKNVWAVR